MASATRRAPRAVLRAALLALAMGLASCGGGAEHRGLTWDQGNWDELRWQ